MSPDNQDVAFELYVWKYLHGTSFTCRLFDLIDKADGPNRAKIAFAYPMHVLIWQEWQSSISDRAFFESYNCPEPQAGWRSF